MESQQPTQDQLLQSLKADIYAREAKRLIGEIASIKAKAESDVHKITSSPNYVGHGSSNKVWGNSLKSNYAETRRRARSLKGLFIKELDVVDSPVLDFLFTECNDEGYSENMDKLDQGIKGLGILIESV